MSIRPSLQTSILMARYLSNLCPSARPANRRTPTEAFVDLGTSKHYVYRYMVYGIRYTVYGIRYTCVHFVHPSCACAHASYSLPPYVRPRPSRSRGASQALYFCGPFRKAMLRHLGENGKDPPMQRRGAHACTVPRHDAGSHDVRRGVGIRCDLTWRDAALHVRLRSMRSRGRGA